MEIRKGSITVYLSLTLFTMIAFFTAIIQGARVNATKMKMQLSVDLGIESVLAEYSIPLLEEYGLFFIDTAYGGSDGCYYDIAPHMEEYIKKNVNPFYEQTKEKESSGMNRNVYRDWYGIQLENVSVLEGYYATDEKGEVLRQQAIDYMYQYYGITLAEELMGGFESSFGAILENGWDSEDSLVEKEMGEKQSEIQNSQGTEYVYETTNGEETTTTTVEVHTDDPTANLVNNKESLLLNMILKEDASALSNKAIEPSKYISKRGVSHQGDTNPYEAEFVTDLTNKFLFDEYILLQCDSFDKEQTDQMLEYEVEYIIGGKSSDKDNLVYVANRLLLMREAMNIAQILTIPGKAEAILGAAELFACGIPFLVPVYQTLFTVGWAYLESMQDVSDLFAGKKVPLWKDANTWKTDLDNLIKGAANVKEVDTGLDYQDYLRILLALEKEEEKSMRLMDIMEMNIRLVEGYETFQMDCAVEGFLVQITFASKVGGYTITKKRVYDTGPAFRN